MTAPDFYPIFKRAKYEKWRGISPRAAGAAMGCRRCSASCLPLPLYGCAALVKVVRPVALRLHLDNARSAGKLRLLGNTKRIFEACCCVGKASAQNVSEILGWIKSFGRNQLAARNGLLEHFRVSFDVQDLEAGVFKVKQAVAHLLWEPNDPDRNSSRSLLE